MSKSLQLHGLEFSSILQNTRVGGRSLLQGIFPTQESNQGLLPCRQILYQLSYQGSQIDVHIDIYTHRQHTTTETNAVFNGSYICLMK